MLADIREDLAAFGVEFDAWSSERALARAVRSSARSQRLAAHGHTYDKDGALWLRSSAFGDGEDRVLVRANGQQTYFAPDLAYHLDKRERGFARLIDVWGADHHGYIARMRAALMAMGEHGECLEVCLMQFVSLYRGGEKIPMGKRDGQFVTLRQLREEVGNDACRLFYLMRSHDQPLDFDLELAKSRSNDNPVYYLQYAHARVASVMKQLAARGLSYDAASALASLERLDSTHEAAVLTALARYPEVLAQAAAMREPHTLVHFLRELAQHFHTWYNAAHFIVEDARDPQRPPGPRAGRAAGDAQRSGAARRLRAGEHVSNRRLTARDYKGVGRGGPGLRRAARCGARIGGRTAGRAGGLRQRSSPRAGPRPTRRAAADARVRATRASRWPTTMPPARAASDAGNEYDFYAGLPKFEVVVPEKEHGTHVDAAARIERPGTYFLQVGSYRDMAEAERMQAQLARQSISANVQRVAARHRRLVSDPHRPDQGSGAAQPPAPAAAGGRDRHAGDPRRRLAPSVVGAVADLDAERAQLAIQVRALHVDALGEQSDLAVAQLQLLLQVGALEVLARLAHRQRQQILLDQRRVDRRLRGQLALHFLERDLLRAAAEQQPPQQIAQLAQVVRPRVVAQPVLRRHAAAPEVQLLALGELVDALAQQLRHVLGVLAQRRHPQRQHRELRVQLATDLVGLAGAAFDARAARWRSRARRT